ncbi:peptidase S26B, signal peptidase (plasmid) [Pseudarthrobacter chlorophenolicus A6]|uniref:Signal peptidase I n=1 Tax=Pseudarthrobacter chlorophenolicus (strain ATCC 700700 / DSM 12829 / CIP 107037 / JCM 12360 / KCTC 9906 / NCIMB 13794 / A6) TaxID=452863 RepID=B8HHT8_PSECP|nr:signal peptidase I [Pseudarthrobacter chlorophenolicus]ACL41985.1 peptidase S26B, signal peptidase [Pseudarthrobacter chlorophenolicus A6]SDQ19888.1 signal peptidase, endoplasmic reticulum-type [Pseudarthrobacter chlorophenolicus]
MTTLPDHQITPPADTGSTPKPAIGSRLIDLGVNVAFAAALFLVAVAAVLPALTGGTAMTVMTGSMAPALPPGHILIYHPVAADTLKVGDVIAYQPDKNITGGVPITHRVIGVHHTGGHAEEIIVQGDANPVPDKPVRPEQIIGKMDYYIPFAGMLRLLAFHAGLASLFDLLPAGLIGYGIFLFVRALLPGRRKAKPEAAADGIQPAAHCLRMFTGS